MRLSSDQRMLETIDISWMKPGNGGLLCDSFLASEQSMIMMHSSYEVRSRYGYQRNRKSSNNAWTCSVRSFCHMVTHPLIDWWARQVPLFWMAVTSVSIFRRIQQQSAFVKSSWDIIGKIETVTISRVVFSLSKYMKHCSDYSYPMQMNRVNILMKPLS